MWGEGRERIGIQISQGQRPTPIFAFRKWLGVAGVNLINVDIGNALNQLFKWAMGGPARINAVFFVLLLFSAAAALGFPAHRVSFIATAIVALIAIVAIGSIAAAEPPPNGAELAPKNSASGQHDHRRPFMNLVQLNNDTYERWLKGEFADPAVARKLRGKVLEAVLAIEAARLQDLGLRGASLLVVGRDGDEYVVRRVVGPLEACLSRDDRCPASSDLREAFLRYAPHSEYHWIPCCGRQLAIGATADVAFDIATKEEVSRFALFYQTQYERLRLYERTAALQAEGLPTT